MEFLEIIDGEDKSSPLKNCIRNNYRHIRKWAKRTHTNAFRIYDRDIKEYPLVIDYYDGRLCIQYLTYNPAIDELSVELQKELSEVLADLFQVEETSLFWKTRRRLKNLEQYEKVDQTRDFFTVWEYGIRFKINLQDYLDTGLFLDHRETRRLVAGMSQGKRVLNLFAYTCSFSVHAAAAGAASTKSVDMSNTYTVWGRDNFILNGIPLDKHEIVRADCLKYLEEEVKTDSRYDIIIIDPPTLSRSKKMEELFDIQRDYVFLISHALKLLAPGGVIFFSTNSRKFVFDSTLFSRCSIVDITEKTMPLDFRKKSHSCWKITCL